MAGGAVIGALRVVLGADTAALDKGLKNAEGSISKFSRQVGIAGAALAASMAAAMGGISVAVGKALADADNLGKLCVLDIKTGAMYPSYGPQLAAYKNAVEHETGRRVQGRYAVELRDDGTYRLHPMTDSEDWAVFLSCLTLHRYRNKHAA